MSLEQLCSTWEKTNVLPEDMRHDHLSNLEKIESSGKKIIEGRIHIDVMGTLVREIFDTEPYEEKFELINKPVHDLILILIDAGKDVRLASSLSQSDVKNALRKASVDSRISDLIVMDKGALLKETQFGQEGYFELLIDDRPERYPTHATHRFPGDFKEQEPS